MVNDDKSRGLALKLLRQEACIGPHGCAHLIGVRPSELLRLESGEKYAWKDHELVSKVALFYGVTVTDTEVKPCPE